MAIVTELTQKRLVESLQNLGLSGDAIQRYVLAWRCYQALYAPQQPQVLASSQNQRSDMEGDRATLQLLNVTPNFRKPGANRRQKRSKKWLVAVRQSSTGLFLPKFYFPECAERR